MSEQKTPDLLDKSIERYAKEQADCVKNRPAMIILGTILFREGSVFE